MQKTNELLGMAIACCYIFTETIDELTRDGVESYLFPPRMKQYAKLLSKECDRVIKNTWNKLEDEGNSQVYYNTEMIKVMLNKFIQSNNKSDLLDSWEINYEALLDKYGL